MEKVQVLVATMRQDGFQKVQEMNIQTDAIFANQADRCSVEKCELGDKNIRMITTATKGVGINRNIGLLNATGDILIIADDDMQYVDGYETMVKEAFEKCPKADAVLFNIVSIGGESNRRENKKIKRIRFFNAFNYGAARIAVKRTSLSRHNIFFNTNFGGGTKFSSGEDSLFLADMLKKKLKIYCYPATIATVDQTQSTWFRGYTKKFFYDKGVLFAAISRRWARLLALQDLIRHRNYKKGGLNFFQAYRLMKEGIKGFSTLREYKE